jgi:hypothetical protein
MPALRRHIEAMRMLEELMEHAKLRRVQVDCRSANGANRLGVPGCALKSEHLLRSARRAVHGELSPSYIVEIRHRDSDLNMRGRIAATDTKF